MQSISTRACRGSAATPTVARAGEMKPMPMASGPIEVRLSLKNYRPIELLGYLSVVDRVDSHTVSYMAQDMTDAAMFMQFVLNYSVSITP